MVIEQATNLGSVNDIIKLIDLFVFLIKCCMPLLAVFGIGYIIHATKRKGKTNKEKKRALKEEAKKQKKNKKEHMRQQKESKEIFNNPNAMYKKLDNIQEPINKADYRNLEINFDKNGKMIR